MAIRGLEGRRPPGRRDILFSVRNRQVNATQREYAFTSSQQIDSMEIVSLRTNEKGNDGDVLSMSCTNCAHTHGGACGSCACK